MTRRRWTAADLSYDEATHTTRTPDGVLVPHVTAVLAACGLTVDFSTLPRRIQERAEYRRSLGHAVHVDTHAYDDGDLEPAAVADAEVRPFVEAWAEARRSLCLVPVAHGRERHVYHRDYHYTGIEDAVYVDLTDGQWTLVDLKIGDPASAAADLQTAAYAAAWNSEHKEHQVHRRYAVQLRPGLRVPYKVTPYEARDLPRDFARFCACLTVYNEQIARRGRARTEEDYDGRVAI